MKRLLKTVGSSNRTEIQVFEWSMFCALLIIIFCNWLYFIGVVVSWGRCDFGSWWINHDILNSPLWSLETAYSLFLLLALISAFVRKRITTLALISAFASVFMLAAMHQIRETIEIVDLQNDSARETGFSPISERISRLIIAPVTFGTRIETGMYRRLHIDPDFEIKQQIKEQLICEHPFFDPRESYEEMLEDIDTQLQRMRAN